MMSDGMVSRPVVTRQKRLFYGAAFLLFTGSAGLADEGAGGDVAADPVVEQPAAVICQDDVVWLHGAWGRARFRVEVADEPAEQQLGLMFREEMPASSGMLFVYPEPRPASFWMENTLIPLDMLFFDETGSLIRVHENAIPLDRTPLPGGDNVKAVLEVNAGMARALGILGVEYESPGDAVIAHPSFDSTRTVFSCAGE